MRRAPEKNGVNLGLELENVGLNLTLSLPDKAKCHRAVESQDGLSHSNSQDLNTDTLLMSTTQDESTLKLSEV